VHFETSVIELKLVHAEWEIIFTVNLFCGDLAV